MNNKFWGTFEDNSQIHVKSAYDVLTQKNVPHLQGFALCVLKAIDKKSLDYIIVFNLDGQKYSCHLGTHTILFGLKKDISSCVKSVIFLYELSKTGNLNVFPFHQFFKILYISVNCFVCYQSHFRQVLKLRG